MRNSLFGSVDLLVAAPDPPGRRVERHSPAASTGSRRLDRAPGERPQAGGQLGEGKGFDQVVVGAGVETGDAVGDAIARGQQQDRRLDARRAQPAADLEAVDAGQHDVEHDRVVVADVDPVERLLAVAARSTA